MTRKRKPPAWATMDLDGSSIPELPPAIPREGLPENRLRSSEVHIQSEERKVYQPAPEPEPRPDDNEPLCSNAIAAGLTRGMAARLAAAVQNYPSIRLACGACGVTYKTFEGWFIAGTLPSAPAELQQFTIDVLNAESKVAGGLYTDLRQNLLDGGQAASAIVKFMKLRFPSIGEDPDLVTLIDERASNADRRNHLLQDPPPAMRAELERFGWRKLTEEERRRLES